MRDTEVMMDLIVGMAIEEDKIRAVELNGSRVNKTIEADFFQDFDVVYYTRDVPYYRDNREWIDRFGEMMIMQMPEAMDDPPAKYNGTFVYLMQFKDGNRIDLTFRPIPANGMIEREGLSQILLDKDKIFTEDHEIGDYDFYPQVPTQKAFEDCCNEYWWVSAYVAKALWRGQIMLAKEIFEKYVRDMMKRQLVWHYGDLTNYQASPGKGLSKIETVLSEAYMNIYKQTFPRLFVEEIWDAHLIMCDLFDDIANKVARNHKLKYNTIEASCVRKHLEHIRFLPKDAKSMY